MFSPTEAFCRSTPPASSALQPLLGLPLTGSTGGYAHQTTLRLFSSSAPPKRTSQSGAGRRAQLREPRIQDLKILEVPAIGLGGVAWGWGSLVTGRKVAEEEEAVQSSAPAQCQCTREDRSPEVPAGGKLCLHHTTTTGRLGCSNQPDSRLKLPQRWSLIVSGIKTRSLKQLCLKKNVYQMQPRKPASLSADHSRKAAAAWPRYRLLPAACLLAISKVRVEQTLHLC